MYNNEADKYDIAISFLSDDEDLALKIYTDLSSAFKVFIYSKKQEELTGTDGVTKLREIFKERSNLIVILHRDGWGHTQWTSVEEKAIEEFGLKNRWKGILLVKLDASSPPSWFPTTDIYLDFETYGYDGLIGAIKLRAQEMGSTPKLVTAVDIAKIAENKLIFEKKRTAFIHSEDGVTTAFEEVAKLFNQLDVICKDIKSKTKLEFAFGKKRDQYILQCYRTTDLGVFGHKLNIIWAVKYANSLKDSGLIIQIINSVNRSGEEVPKLEEISYDFELSQTYGYCWRKNKDGKEISTLKLADTIVQDFIKSFF